MDNKELAIDSANKANEYAEKAIDYAIECGIHLIKVKQEVNHGDFLPWIEKNMPIDYKQCQRYLKLSNNIELINRTRVSYLKDMSIRGALELISTEEKRLKEIERKKKWEEDAPNRERRKQENEKREIEKKKKTKIQRKQEIDNSSEDKRVTDDDIYEKQKKEAVKQYAKDTKKESEEYAKKVIEIMKEDIFDINSTSMPVNKEEAWSLFGKMINKIDDNDFSKLMIKYTKQKLHPDKTDIDQKYFQFLNRIQGVLL